MAVACLLVGTAAAALPPTESEPTLPTKELAPESVALSGPAYVINTPTQVRNFLGQFSIRSDWGNIDAAGGVLLALRVAEMPALAELDKVTHSQVFAKAIADSASKTINGVVRVATDPVGTITGIPAGVGRLFTRTAETVSSAAGAISASAKRDSNAKSDGSIVTDYAKEFAGLNRARRALAKSAGIDPYTGNPLLRKRLEELAWASVAGAVPVTVAMSAVSGAAGTALKVTKRLDGLVWDLSPNEIKQKLEPRLVAGGNSPESAKSFLRNTTFTPTLQLAFVNALEDLEPVGGQEGLLRIAIASRSEAHAHFLIQQLRMIRRYAGNQQDPVRELIALEQSVVARLASGRRVLVLPVDYFSWTVRVEELAQRADQETGPRELIVAGIASPVLTSAARELGWRVSDRAGYVLD
jgi:hypothetical protein